MGRWTDVAAWGGPIPNCGPGRMSAHMGVVIHTAEGSYDGTIAWQRNPAADVGSHFVTAQDGRCVQLIDTDIRSWCQSAGNDAWLSVENAGFGSRGEALTAGQVEACARILARAHREYGVPLQVSNSPSTRGLGWHGMGGAAWGGHTGCPGNAIRAQLPTIVARAAQLVGAAPTQTPTPQPTEDDMPHFSSHQVKTGPGRDAAGNLTPATVTEVGLPMSGSLWADRTCYLSFKADFGKAKLRYAISYDTGAGKTEWKIGEVTVDSTKPRGGPAGAGIPVPAKADGISLFRVPIDADDRCETPVALIVEIG